MQPSFSLTRLPLRFQKLLSVVSLAYIVLFGVMLSIQQAFYMRFGYGVSSGADFVVMLATITAVVAPFAAGVAMVSRGGRWHRLTAGSVVLVASILIGLICSILLQASGVLNAFPSALIMAAPSLVGTVATLGALLVVAVRPDLWVKRMKLFVILTVIVIAIALGQAIVSTLLNGQASDLFSWSVLFGFPALAVVIAYRAMNGIARTERLFRVVLIMSAVLMVGSVSVFTSTAVLQAVSAMSGDIAGQVVQWMMIGLVLVTYVGGIWLARPRRIAV